MAVFLFWFQIILSYVYSVPLIYNLYCGKTNGITQALFLFFFIYVVISLSLSISDYKKNKTRLKRMTMVIYLNWTILIGSFTSLGFIKVHWLTADTIFTVVIFIFILLTLLKYKSLKDPIARGWIIIWCKSVPQLWLTVTFIFIAGNSSGYPGESILAAHLTGIPRLWQIYSSGKYEGWNRETKGLFFGEAGNVVTWCIVTIAWIYLRISQ